MPLGNSALTKAKNLVISLSLRAGKQAKLTCACTDSSRDFSGQLPETSRLQWSRHGLACVKPAARVTLINLFAYLCICVYCWLLGTLGVFGVQRRLLSQMVKWGRSEQGRAWCEKYYSLLFLQLLVLLQRECLSISCPSRLQSSSF
jgi:hypothetical protein